ncbi:MAG: UDP-N-acetylmuramoyl-L-alanine--D-glutamate ligase [Nitriliruptoraceae bacterium]
MMVPAAVRGDGVASLDVDRALVIGAGSSGRAAARLLTGAGVDVVLVEERAPRSDTEAADLAASLDVEVVFDRRANDVLDRGFDLLVPSPGVAETTPALLRAEAAGIRVWSEPELALRRYPRRVLAVTGTNGKTSTTELLTAMCVTDGMDAHACGNIGIPVSEAAAVSDPGATLVAELSSFQLRFTERLAPHVGVLLNLAPDHLDWHRDLASYRAAKARLFAAQTTTDWAVANDDDPTTVRIRDGASVARRASFSASQEVEVGVGLRPAVGGGTLVAALPGEHHELLPVGALSHDGQPVPLHRVANVAAAATVALLAGVSPDAVARAVRGQVPARHRFETVAIDRRGVRFIDDSKATNVHAALAALHAAGPAVWIAGGLAKGVELAPLAAGLGAVHDAVLIGAAADALVGVCEDAGVTAHRARDLEEAVTLAAQLAHPGDAVLLAPACASFDQFESYAHRGDVFTAAAHRTAQATAATRPEEGDR